LSQNAPCSVVSPPLIFFCSEEGREKKGERGGREGETGTGERVAVVLSFVRRKKGKWSRTSLSPCP